MKTSKTIRLMPLLLWSIFSMLLVSKTSLAQTTKVSGTIINDRTSAPASGATIAVKNTNRSVTADATGKFIIDASPGDVLCRQHHAAILSAVRIGGYGRDSSDVNA